MISLSVYSLCRILLFPNVKTFFPVSFLQNEMKWKTSSIFFRLKWLNCVRHSIHFIWQQSIDHELSAVDNSLSRMIEIKLDGGEYIEQKFTRWHWQLWTNQISLVLLDSFCGLTITPYAITGKPFHKSEMLGNQNWHCQNVCTEVLFVF